MTQIRLVVSDVDGTLMTRDKQLTPATRDAVRALREHGIRFAITSSRPTFGMNAIVDALGIDQPLGPFNGSSIINPDFSAVEEHVIPPTAVARSVDLLNRRGVDIWVFTNRQWIITRDDGKYVPHETAAIATAALRVTDFTHYLDKTCKLVGVSGDFDLLARCESELQDALGDQAHAVRSQNYYLDVTPPGFDKGTFVDAMSRHLAIPPQHIATIGDMSNDVPMFRRSGLSFAMGNASKAVKAEATHVTASNEDDGFAKAMAQIMKTEGSFFRSA
jgi:Cof subfamily protein (haloacid dehalogenase superfamily)